MTVDNYDNESGDQETDDLISRRPLAVRHELRVVHGEEAKLLGRRQAKAIRALLRWMAEEDETLKRAV